jgi:sulfur-oxidizing protein SoxA
MSHEMETGQRKDAQGKTFPRGSSGVPQPGSKTVLAAQWGPAVSKNPFRFVQVQGRREGRQGADHLGRQSRRQANRRSDDRLKLARFARAMKVPGMKTGLRVAAFSAVLGGAAAAPTLLAQNSAVDEIAKYRAALQDGNPAELWEARGEAIWKQKRGPKQVSLEQCDLGLGAGVVKGAYARLPRYFADADRVMDLESRSVHGRAPGFSDADSRKQPAGTVTSASPTWRRSLPMSSESRGVAMNVGLANEGAEMYRLGERIFCFGRSARLGCVTCHGAMRSVSGCRPAEPDDEGARKRTRRGPHTACRRASCVRFSGDSTTASASNASRTRIRPDASIALTMFLARNANGAPFDAPAIKR